MTNLKNKIKKFNNKIMKLTNTNKGKGKKYKINIFIYTVAVLT